MLAIMTIPPSPKRSEFKTRKEYRFAVGKHPRAVRKEPIIVFSAIIFSIVLVTTKGNGPATLAAIIVAPIAFTYFKKRFLN
jgi:hypothetical protein